MANTASGVHFVLVHGSCHGAWCWYKVATLLEAAGHRVTALDLAAAGINPKQVADIHNLYDYIEPFTSFFEALPPEEKVVVVGHSKGGIPAAALMEKFPHKIAVAVFLTAFMPGPDLTTQEIDKEMMRLYQVFGYTNDGEYTFDQNNRMTSFSFGPLYLATHCYQLSPPEDLKLAIMLARPYPSCDDEIGMREVKFTKENYGSVPRVYIVSGQDVGIPVVGQRWMIEKNPPNEAREIPDSDHMVMACKPQELVSHFLEIAGKYR